MSAQLRHVNNHDHLCLVYESQDDQAAAFVPFFQSGLVQDQLCVYITDESDPTWILEKLRLNEFPIDSYVQRGAFRIIHTIDAYLKDGSFDLDRMNAFWARLLEEAQEEGYSLVRASGEMSWALRDFPGCDKLLEYESRINSVIPTVNLIGLCQYNRNRFDSTFIAKVMHTHPFVCVSNQLLYNPSFLDSDGRSQSDSGLELRATLDNLLMSKQLVERQQECEELYEELISLARVVSHEVQAPLNVLQAYLRLLSARYKGKLGPDADEFIEKSSAASGLIARMIDSLWNYARVDSPAESISEDLDVMPIVNNVIEDLAPLISKTKADIDHDKTFPRVRMARRKLLFLLKELVENGIKHRRNGEVPSIYIGAEDREEEWLFYVRDNGRGIDPIYSTDIFRLFHRLANAPSDAGVGMGLPICRRIVQHYRGRIWFESSVDDATTFYFTIPKRAVRPSRSDTRERNGGRRSS